jgi:hypothetical protein
MITKGARSRATLLFLNSTAVEVRFPRRPDRTNQHHSARAPSAPWPSLRFKTALAPLRAPARKQNRGDSNPPGSGQQRIFPCRKSLHESNGPRLPELPRIIRDSNYFPAASRQWPPARFLYQNP